MLTRRGAFRQRGMDLPKIQTSKQKSPGGPEEKEPSSKAVSALTIQPDISQVEAATKTTITSPILDVDAELAEFIKVDDSCLEFLTPTSGGSTATVTATPGSGGGDDDVPWPRPMDRDIHGRSDLKRTAPQWAIQVRLVLSKDFEQDPTTDYDRYEEEDESTWGQRRPSVVDRRFSYGRKIQAGGGRRPSDFSLRSLPPGLQVHYEDIPFELTLCSEADSLYSN